MIARIWKGAVNPADADEYAGYIRRTGFAEYAETPGNRGAWMLRRDQGEHQVVDRVEPPGPGAGGNR
jgi:hypothetical protein